MNIEKKRNWFCRLFGHKWGPEVIVVQHHDSIEYTQECTRCYRVREDQRFVK